MYICVHHTVQLQYIPIAIICTTQYSYVQYIPIAIICTTKYSYVQYIPIAMYIWYICAHHTAQVLFLLLHAHVLKG